MVCSEVSAQQRFSQYSDLDPDRSMVRSEVSAQQRFETTCSAVITCVFTSTFIIVAAQQRSCSKPLWLLAKDFPLRSKMALPIWPLVSLSAARALHPRIHMSNASHKHFHARRFEPAWCKIQSLLLGTSVESKEKILSRNSVVLQCVNTKMEETKPR